MTADVGALVAKFRENERDCRAPGYREHQLRVEYLNPLFELLGWDVTNAAGRPVALKDVVHEDAVRVAGRAKAPDYGFRVEGARRFFVEAKSPAVGVGDAVSALQLRRYGWSAKLPISVLTDFETLAIYDCRVAPTDKDDVGRALLASYQCDEFVSRWDEISGMLSREAVANGSLDQFLEAEGEAQGFVPVDQAFLRQIEGWRKSLAKEIAQRNKNLDLEELNSAVQLIIDRIIFLRIAEDRGIEPHGALLNISRSTDVYRKLVGAFTRADSRYNSGLFYFEEERGYCDVPDTITPTLIISDVVVGKMLRGLYRPESAYEFSVMPAEILGQVYEQFLGKVIRLTPKGAVVDDKPEVKKAGGVYYTPVDVVRYMVERALEPHLSTPPLQSSQKVGKKTIKSPIRVLDPACGSGSFLIEAYQQLLDWHLEWYVNDGPEKHSRGRNPKLFSAGLNGWRLSIAEKRRILLSHIYGCDIDAQAVEVTKLSLLLKMLEGESNDALASQMSLFETRVLPDISGNVRCGNSIVGTDIVPELLGQFASDELVRNNPFDWPTEFPFISEAGGFDAIVGNPPYIDSEWMTKHWPTERRYCTDRYPYASGNWDIFCVFIGRSVDLLKRGGSLSFIVPNKLMTATYARQVRRYLLEKGTIESIRDYSSVSVFPVAVYPVVFAFKEGKPGRKTTYEKVLLRTPAKVETAEPVERALPVDGSEWRIEGTQLDAMQFRPLGTVATICDAATVGEAYELRDLLTDKKNPGTADLVVVNSGTIDPYIHHWGHRALRYIKRSILHPVLSDRSQTQYAARRVGQAKSPKILVANMTRRLEAIYDEKGTILATKSVNVILPSCNPWPLLAILNSKFMSKYYEQCFHGRKLAGGYLQVVPATLRQLPIPSAIPKGAARTLERLCRQLMETKVELVSKTGRARTLAERTIAGLEGALETEVSKLYAPLLAGTAPVAAGGAGEPSQAAA